MLIQSLLLLIPLTELASMLRNLRRDRPFRRGWCELIYRYGSAILRGKQFLKQVFAAVAGPLRWLARLSKIRGVDFRESSESRLVYSLSTDVMETDPALLVSFVAFSSCVQTAHRTLNPSSYPFAIPCRTLLDPSGSTKWSSSPVTIMVFNIRALINANRETWWVGAAAIFCEMWPRKRWGLAMVTRFRKLWILKRIFLLKKRRGNLRKTIYLALYSTICPAFVVVIYLGIKSQLEVKSFPSTVGTGSGVKGKLSETVKPFPLGSYLIFKLFEQGSTGARTRGKIIVPYMPAWSYHC